MLFEEDKIDLPEDVFRLLRDFIKKYCGLYFDDKSKYFLERRLARRLRKHQLKSFKDYYHFLSYDRRKESELVEVVDCLTTNETYFFREMPQLMAFIEEIVPAIASEGVKDRPLRIWSAGCSSGEEPYTIAMLLMESRMMDRFDVEITGSDINQNVLGAARRGVYRSSSFRATDGSYVQKYFEEEAPGSHRIKDEVKKYVNFSYMNLFDPYKVSFLKQFDIIFCRNVIIYFDAVYKKRLIEMFYEKLKAGGYLLLGHSESLLNITTAFALVHLKNDMVYQKPLAKATGAASGGLAAPTNLKAGT